MSLLRRGSIVADDFQPLADDAAGPDDAGRYVISWSRWQKERPVWPANHRPGLLLPNTLDVVAAAAEDPGLTDAPLIALSFPGFADGRAYSQARLLRDRLGYQGELRAVGSAVVRDQIHSLLRCGFDSFDLRADQDPEQCLAAFHDFSEEYQPAADPGTPVLLKRRRQR